MNFAVKFSGRFGLVCFGLVTLALACQTTRKPTKAPTALAKALPKAAVESFDAAWRLIEETHFDRQFNGVDWVAVRNELRPRAEAATSDRELRSVIQEMLDRLGQSHMVLIPRETAEVFDAEPPSNATPSGAQSAAHSADRSPPKKPPTAGPSSKNDNPVADGAGDAGFEVRLVENQILVTRVEPGGPAERAGLKPGWIVKAIDEATVTDLLDLLPDKLEARRKKVLAWTTVMAPLKGNPGSTVRMQFLDAADSQVSMEIKRGQTLGVPAKLGFLPTFFARLQSQRIQSENGAAIGIIRFNLWMFPIAAAFDNAIDGLRNCDGIVLDLRGNVGGIAGMIMGFSGHFLKDRISLGTMKGRELELQFIANPRFVNPAGQRVEPYAGPLAILTDDLSLSASEIFAGGMQAIGRARIFGQPTMGAALPSMYDRLPNGDVLMHAVGDFVTSTGIRLESRGVVPDEPIVLKRRELLSGRDATLAAALNWIDQQRRK